MDGFSETLAEMLIYIVYALVSLVTGTVAMIVNKKRVRKRMDLLDYNEGKQKRKNNYTRNIYLDEQITLKIKEEDEHFDEIAFKEWAKETFVEFQKAWSNKNMIQIRSRLDDNLYEQYKILLDTNVEEDCANIVDVKKINYVDFSGHSEDNEKEIIEVVINAVLINYTINKQTNQLVSGSESVKIRTTYKMIFYRKTGAQTNGINNVVCPNCGGKILSNQNRCEYCKTWVLNNMKVWVLNSIERY